MSVAPVFTLLAAASPVTAIIGTNPVRCFPAGFIPQSPDDTNPNVNLPCVTWQQIGGTVNNILQDHPPSDNQRVQIDCWALTFSGAQALAEAVQSALELNGYCVSLNGHDYDTDTRRYRASFDWSFIVSR